MFDFNRFDNVKHPFVFIIDMYVIINPINDMAGVGTFCHDVKNGTDSNITVPKKRLFAKDFDQESTPT